MAGGVTAIHRKRDPGNERRVVRRQEVRRPGDLVRPAEAPKLVLLANVVGIRKVRHHRLEHRRVNEARANRIGPDAAAAVVVGKVLGQQDHTSLGGVVAAASFAAFQALHAGHSDDGSASLFDHLRKDGFGGQHRAGEVDVLTALPLGQIQLVNHAAGCHSGGRDQDVQAAMFFDDAGGQSRLSIFAAYIQFVERSREVHTGIQIATHNNGTLGGESLATRQPNTRCRPRDERNAPLESAGGGVLLHRLCSFRDRSGMSTAVLRFPLMLPQSPMWYH